MRIVVSEFMSLDGVVQAPGAPQEDTSGGFRHGGWSMPFFDPPTMGAVIEEFARRSTALLQGRRTYLVSAAAWPTRGGGGFADWINGVHKYVVSDTLSETELAWAPTTVIRSAHWLEEVTALRNAPGGDMYVYGSLSLARALLAAQLVDELVLMIEPITLGGGQDPVPVRRAGETVRAHRGRDDGDGSPGVPVPAAGGQACGLGAPRPIGYLHPRSPTVRLPRVRASRARATEGEHQVAHPNEELLRRGYEAFAKGDLETVMSIFDEDIVWHSPGRSALAGDFKGHQQVQEFFGRIFEMSGGTFRNEVHDILANDEHAAVMVHARAEREGKTFDAMVCHIWHLSNGKATEFWNLTVDPYTSDEFWS